LTTAITPNVAAHAGLAPLASRLVDTDSLPWQPTRFPGIEVKNLLFDRASGLVSSTWRATAGKRCGAWRTPRASAPPPDQRFAPPPGKYFFAVLPHGR
jgi:hypothetical protein